MKDVLLSICISSYNRGEKCVQLVNKILSIQDDRYNIFICDDCSEEETYRELKNLKSPIIKLVRNKENMGACKNWFETINSGNGKYILHVLDRDDIRIQKLKLIMDILEKNSVGAGYFGKSLMYPVDGIKKQVSYAICQKGREAFLTMAGVPIHPTGFFIKREVWKRGGFRKFFYKSDQYGIYPHSYVLSVISVKEDMLFSPISFCDIAYRTNNQKSRFYEKKSKDYWWLPDSVIRTTNSLMLYACRLSQDSYKEEFICRRFKDGLYRATIGYKKTMENQAEMRHYGFEAHVVPIKELIIASFKYSIIFLHVFKKIGITEYNIQKKLKNIWIANLKNILMTATKNENLEELLLVSNRNFAQFRVMNQWLKIRQEGKNLSEYFSKKRYTKIAVYGMGYIGETLVEELRSTDVKVVYGIDRNAEAVYSDIHIVSMNDSLQKVDVVVVTILDMFGRIADELKRKIDCPIISLQDVIYDI